MILATYACLAVAGIARSAVPPRTPPVVDGPWLRPAAVADAAPVWGFADGLRVGLAPLPGPRGLVRLYTPYLGQADGIIMNFLAIEPTVVGQRDRDYSEMQPSRLDGRPGLRFTALDAPNDTPAATPATTPATTPARGVVRTVDGHRALVLYVAVEPFANGAHVYVRLTFRADRPHAVGVATFAYPDSKPLDRCVVSATMGNYGRLRDLKLANRVVSAGALWPHPPVGDAFSDRVRFGLAELTRTNDGTAVAVATPDEASPETAVPAHGGWRYTGVAAKQTWTCFDPDPALGVIVNGRTTYFRTGAAIPGGVAFENFEMNAPFKQGGEFWFAIDPVDPAATQTSTPEGRR